MVPTSCEQSYGVLPWCACSTFLLCISPYRAAVVGASSACGGCCTSASVRLH